MRDPTSSRRKTVSLHTKERKVHQYQSRDELLQDAARGNYTHVLQSGGKKSESAKLQPREMKRSNQSGWKAVFQSCKD